VRGIKLTKNIYFYKGKNIMTLYERLEELRTTTNLETNPHETYAETESTLVGLLAEQIKDAELITTAWGKGRVIEAQGINIDSMVMDIAFDNSTKRFAVEPVISGKVFFTKFADNDEIKNAWNVVLGFHTEITRQYNKIKNAEVEAERAAKKKAVADLKAAEKFEREKARAIREFENLASTPRAKDTTNDFYYCLGWLAKNAGAISAKIPDYLLSYFESQFGVDAKPYVVDSNKRTVNGNSMQWAIGMKIALPKKVHGLVPSMLADYLSKNGHDIANTPFIWDLIDNYGFQFGTEQDIEKIRACVPSEYIDSFELALA
jgi:hypothetical protein